MVDRVRDPDRLARLKKWPCIVCLLQREKQTGITDVHHIKRNADGSKLGASQKAGDDRTIPLCCDRHHWNGVQVHMGSKEFEARYGNENFLLDIVDSLINQYGDRLPF